MCMFFFKQKTAYEMRISDWSSDVCSSDLLLRREDRAQRIRRVHRSRQGAGYAQPAYRRDRHLCALRLRQFLVDRDPDGGDRRARAQPAPDDRQARSEEHTSELQSLMRISYAVFCLKKKKIPIQHTLCLPFLLYTLILFFVYMLPPTT